MAVNIGAIDLNLLLVLHTVLEERNATRAAKRLHVTQSAVSNALARLRDLLSDPLLVRHARGLSPTPYATSLRPQLAAAMRELAKVFEHDAHFDPATSTREFSLACADYCGVVLLPRLIELLRERAPHATLRVITLEQLVANAGLAEATDLHVGMPPQIAPGCSALPLFSDELVCLVRPSARTGRFSLPEYGAASHVRVHVLDNALDPIDRELAKRGLGRSIALTVPHFSMLAPVIERTGYVATLSRRLAEAYLQHWPLSLRTPPIRLPPRALQMIWHRRTESDPGAKFFRDTVRSAAAALATKR